ncbi:MAG: PHB depolymerase family esterase [Anaerolineales bacterium]
MKRHLPALTLLFLAAAALTDCSPRAATPAATPTVAPTVPPGDSEHSIAADSMQRSYLLHVPPGFSAAEPAALVFVFHGLAEDGLYMSVVTGMSEIADANGFLVVYPNGTAPPGPLSWNAGGCCGYALNNRVDEPAFIRAILADVGRMATIDPKRIYATGFSNGALLSYRLGCEMSDTFAAIAPVAGILSQNPCQPDQPVSVIHIHGDGDVSVPFGGGGTNPSTGLPFPSVDRGIAAWVRLDGCVDSPEREQLGIVAHTKYASCRTGSAVELYVVKGLGHAWPPPSILPASKVIWEFFAAHPRRSAATAAVPV